LLFPSFFFGKLLYSATAAYKSGQYTEADGLLDKALAINQADFEANFWKMRVAAMKGEYQTAIDLLGVCKKMKIAAKVDKLFGPWEVFCTNQIIQPTVEGYHPTWLDEKTDELLLFYQHHRDFGLMDIVWAVLLFAVLLFSLLNFYHFFLKTWLNNSSIMPDIWLLIYAPIICLYYSRKSIVIPNIYVLLQYTVNKLSELLKSKNFLVMCGVIIFGLMRIGGLGGDRGINLPHIVAAILAAPIMEEIFFRGFLYGYLRKYGKLISWSVVTALVCLSYGWSVGYWNVVVSVICLSVYDNEKTIIAPIVIHILNNQLDLIIAMIR